MLSNRDLLKPSLLTFFKRLSTALVALALISSNIGSTLLCLQLKLYFYNVIASFKENMTLFPRIIDAQALLIIPVFSQIILLVGFFFFCVLEKSVSKTMWQ